MSKENNKEVAVVYNIPQLDFSFSNERYVDYMGNRITSGDVANIIRALFDPGEIEMREAFFVLYFNEAFEPIGYYKLSTGVRTATIADVGMILAGALTSLSSAMILVHNHPVGITNPSDEDVAVTHQCIEAAKYHGLLILDHIVVASNTHTSMAENGLCDLVNPYPITIEVEQDEPGETEFIVDLNPDGE